MKKSSLFILCLTLSAMAFAQRPSKEQMEADKKKLAEAMKELNDKTSKMDPKARKGYDSMLNVFGMGDKMNNAINQVNNDNSTAKSGKAAVGLIPAKDTKAIATIGATPTNAAIGTFVSGASNTTFSSVLPAAKNKAGEIYTALKQKNATPGEIGNVAAALWMQGHSQVALSLMAQTCKSNPDNIDNLSNYAAMLSMMGAPEIAIPILNNLNARFRNNSTILNNLGQAWFALGDMDKAGRYLDSTLLLCAGHPQANDTKCLIDQSKGNKAAALAHAKAAFKSGSTASRKDKLQQLGYTPGAGDYTNLPPDNKSDDLLNLGPFAPLEFPKSYETQIGYEQQYKQFRNDIDPQLKALQKITDESNKVMVDRLQAQQKAFMAAKNKTLSDPGSVSQAAAMQIAGSPMFSEKMNAKENMVLQNLLRKKTAAIQKIAEFKKGDGAALRLVYDSTIKSINKRWKDVGEGGTENGNDLCSASVDAADKYLNAYNTKLEELYKEYLAAEKQYLNEFSYSSLYTTYPELLPGINAGLKMQWLNDLAYKAEVVGASYGCRSSKSVKGGKLTAFKDPHCNINSEFSQSLGLSNLGFKIKLDCSGMTTEFNALIVGITLNQDLDHAGFGDSFKSCTVSIVPKPGVSAKFGPVEASAKVGAGLDIAIDRTGITDVSVVGSVEAEANILDLRETTGTPEASPVGASAGVEGRISLNSGAGSVDGTGIFKK